MQEVIQAYMQSKNGIVEISSLKIAKWCESRRRIYSMGGGLPTLHGIGCGGNTEPKILIRSKNESNQSNSSPRYKDH